MARRRYRIPGSRRSKGRPLGGHAAPLEIRTFQETERAEDIDRTMRDWRPEPRWKTGPAPDGHRLLGRLRIATGRSLRVRTSLDVDHGRPDAETVGETVERRLGGWVYTIAPSGQIINRRKEV